MRSAVTGCVLVLLGGTLVATQEAKTTTETTVKSDNGKVVTNDRQGRSWSSGSVPGGVGQSAGAKLPVGVAAADVRQGVVRGRSRERGVDQIAEDDHPVEAL